jgi:hypothetical protein
MVGAVQVLASLKEAACDSILHNYTRTLPYVY